MVQCFGGGCSCWFFSGHKRTKALGSKLTDNHLTGEWVWTIGKWISGETIFLLYLFNPAEVRDWFGLV